MPNIRPISELRNNFNEVADLCRTQNEPVFITRNGFGDLVLMSHEAYENMQDMMQSMRRKRELQTNEDLRVQARKALYGVFKSYANPELTALEEGAWERHVVDEYENS